HLGASSAEPDWHDDRRGHADYGGRPGDWSDLRRYPGDQPELALHLLAVAAVSDSLVFRGDQNDSPGRSRGAGTLRSTEHADRGGNLCRTDLRIQLAGKPTVVELGRSRRLDRGYPWPHWICRAFESGGTSPD